MPSIAALSIAASPSPKRRLRSNSTLSDEPVMVNCPRKTLSSRKSPRKCVDDSPSKIRLNEGVVTKVAKSTNWNAADSDQLSAVKESVIVCREDEQKRTVEFSKQCLEQDKAGSLSSNSTLSDEPVMLTTPMKTLSLRKSPRKCVNDSPNRVRLNEGVGAKVMKSPKKKLLDSFLDKPIWNPTDSDQLSAVKEVLHVSKAQSVIVCREDEQKRILEFSKQCLEQDKAGSLYICGCPGTGKSLSMENVKGSLAAWAKETGGELPDFLSITCTSLSTTSEIFNKILEKSQPNKKSSGRCTPLRQLHEWYSQKQQSADTKMMFVIADELDFLITKDRVVLHDLFMLTMLPFSKIILIGIANAIDLADRFLPKLQSLNCKPMVVSFRAYSMDQIIMILKQRLMALPYTVFQPQALELCARKVSAASGDMRKALGICRGAIEMLETELRENACTSNLTSMVRVDHMAISLSRAYKSPIVDTIQSLPQHQQIVLCSAVKLFRRGKKDTTIGELNKYYIDLCKSTSIPPVGIMELSCMCRVLGDQGILKLGQSRDDKLRRVTLQVDEADINFALQGIRFFRNFLQ